MSDSAEGLIRAAESGPAFRHPGVLLARLLPWLLPSRRDVADPQGPTLPDLFRQEKHSPDDMIRGSR